MSASSVPNTTFAIQHSSFSSSSFDPDGESFSLPLLRPSSRLLRLLAPHALRKPLHAPGLGHQRPQGCGNVFLRFQPDDLFRSEPHRDAFGLAALCFCHHRSSLADFMLAILIGACATRTCW